MIKDATLINSTIIITKETCDFVPELAGCVDMYNEFGEVKTCWYKLHQIKATEYKLKFSGQVPYKSGCVDVFFDKHMQKLVVKKIVAQPSDTIKWLLFDFIMNELDITDSAHIKDLINDVAKNERIALGVLCLCPNSDVLFGGKNHL